MEYEVLFAVQLEAENKQELYNKAERISKSMNMYFVLNNSIENIQ